VSAIDIESDDLEFPHGTSLQNSALGLSAAHFSAASGRSPC
jgi:hypothetical protein